MEQQLNCLYNGSHAVPIYGPKNGFEDERLLTINISDSIDKLRIKLRDLSDYSFNYTDEIDFGDFDVIRVNQMLDINFQEFKVNIVEMLHQFQKREMFLKCELGDKKCTLVFFTKSKIKSIVYLTLDLRQADQKVILSEMAAEMQEIQETNQRLQKQLTKCNKLCQDKDSEIKEARKNNNKLTSYFLERLSKIEHLFSEELCKVQNCLTDAVMSQRLRITVLQKKVDVLKRENDLKLNSGDRLIKTMENLRIENMESNATIQELKRQNSSLNMSRVTLEKSVADLNKTVQDLQAANRNLETKKIELETDLKKMSVILTEKENKIDELSKDLVQANNMLVNFNNHYDVKAQQVEELQNELQIKVQQIKEQKIRFNDLLKSYKDYETKYNGENFNKMKQEITCSNQRIHSLEEEIRKLSKMNELLSQKVGQGYFKL